jgi:hypothetical protein
MNPISINNTTLKLKSVLVMFILLPTIASSQSDVTNLIRGGELLFGGLITIFTSEKQEKSSNTIVECVCKK